jgi:hypothetical protein
MAGMSNLLGRSVMVCSLPQCVGSEDPGVLGNQNHISSVTGRKEKGLQKPQQLSLE